MKACIFIVFFSLLITNEIEFYSTELSVMCELAFQYSENSLFRLTKPNLPGPSTRMMNQVLTISI